MFSSFALPDPFLAVLRASCPVFMFCAPGLIFGGIEGVGSRFHVLRSRTCFRRYRRCREQFSCFKFPDPFSAVSTTSGPVFMFFAPGLIFGGSEGVVSHFRVLRSRTRFRQYRRRWVQFSCFVLPDSFSTVPRASRHVSCFAFPDPFSAVPTTSGPVFMFCAPGPVFDETDGVGSRFHVLRSQTHFWRYRRRRVPFSCFALPDSFSVGPRVSGPVFLFCTFGLIFVGTERVGSRFHILRSRNHFRRYEGIGSRFMFCATRIIVGGTEGVVSCFQVLRSQTRFWRY
jgi:hypothetical protein